MKKASVLHTRNYSVKMLLTVRPTKEFSNIPHNLTRLSGAVQAKDLDFFGMFLYYI